MTAEEVAAESAAACAFAPRIGPERWHFEEAVSAPSKRSRMGPLLSRGRYDDGAISRLLAGAGGGA